MSLRDRGKIKWHGAFFMPEHIAMLRGVTTDYYKLEKPILDEYQIQEFESKICLAMEFAFLLQITIWDDGFNKEYTGLAHRLDAINKIIYLELNTPEACLMKMLFADIVKVEVIER
ncbi:YolD-like family protein [Peribacillus deserti]|uniref:YolD-like family protein n=1 Tax=Peribacillus deserti TaxID=673318 RepID=A0A2N5M3C4_9BACI|nr:YolD-like family protein [Peribacillus deserti]PLT28860.1 YolD-like family protein [Peribacillus deserti]